MYAHLLDEIAYEIVNSWKSPDATNLQLQSGHYGNSEIPSTVVRRAERPALFCPELCRVAKKSSNRLSSLENFSWIARRSTGTLSIFHAKRTQNFLSAEESYQKETDRASLFPAVIPLSLFPSPSISTLFPILPRHFQGAKSYDETSEVALANDHRSAGGQTEAKKEDFSVRRRKLSSSFLSRDCQV